MATQELPENLGEQLARLWEDGSRPDLQAFLDALGPQTPAELLDVLRIDQHQSWQHGERRPAESYRQQCPLLREDDEQFLDLVYREFLLRQEHGEAPQLDEYQQRFPELADQLERFAPPGGVPTQDFGSAPPGGLMACDSIDRAALPMSLQHAPTPPEAHGSLTPVPARAAPAAGPQLPGYEIIRELGRGGMGVVYLARQKGLQRLVALKMMLAGNLSQASELDRFRTEAAILARLQHPGIIQIYEIGEHEGQPFFSLEFATGGSLDGKVRGSAQAPAVSAELLEILARAMHAAHQAGVIHRDLKPANILLSPRGAEAEAPPPAASASRDSRERALDLNRWLPKITDFGLAKCLDAGSGQTRSGDVMGTPCYMAPEQALGRIHEVGPRSDIYTLGAILYELLTGRPPFLGENAWDVMSLVVQQEPVAPRRLQPKVPRDLETICLKCLEKSPQRRYQTAEGLADDLQRFREGRPIQARPVSFFGRGVKLVKRRPLVSGLVFLIGLAVTGAGLLAVENLRQGKQLAEQELTRFQRAQADRDKVRDLLQDAEKDAAARRWPEAEALLAPVLALLANNSDLGEYHAQAERLRVLVRGSAQAAGLLQQFMAHCEEVRFRQTQMTGLDFDANITRARTEARAALTLAGMADERQTAPVLGPYVSPRDQEEVAAMCYEQLLTLAAVEAQSLATKGEDAHTQAGRALALLDRAERMGRSATRALHLQRGRYLAQQGDAAGAERARRQADALLPTNAADFYLVGLESYRRKDYDDALKQFGNALVWQETHFWARYLSALCHIKRPELLRTHYLAAVRDLTSCAGQRPKFPWVFLVRGYVHAEVGDYLFAERDFERALPLADTSDARYTLFVNRGVLRLKQRKFTVAVGDFEEAIRLHPDRYQAHLDLARIYQETEQFDKALEAYGTALRSATVAKMDVGPRALATVYRTRADLHQKLGKSEPAQADYAEAVRLDAWPHDHIERGRLLLRDHKPDLALTAFDDALGLQSDHPVAHHLRARALLELRRPKEALLALDRCREKARPTAEVCELRGRVKAELGDHAGAVEEYSEALALQVAVTTHAYRGWAYLIVDAPRLALRDFEAVVKLQPTNADGYNGRGSARIKMGQYWFAVKDAEHAVSLEPTTHRVLYKAARVFAQSVPRADADKNEPDHSVLARAYQERAVALLRNALDVLPADQRARFWREQVLADTAFGALYRSTEFLRLKSEQGKVGRPEPVK